MNIVTEIAVNNHIWNDYINIINENFFNNILRKILALYPHLAQNYYIELSVLLSDDEQIKLLNAEFRSKNTPTNVLSFPEYENKLFKELDFIPLDNYLYLGDIAFSFETIKKESFEGNIEFMHHFIHLTIHSILHLLGHDHIEEDDAELMESIEIELLNSFQIKSPYIQN
ncbi:MAG: rRNA maturation RNase YbeY [Rickettsiaceae bacterium]|nr:rRNA maturation RNase YbeY [Rickettsiaceae bacterium]